MTPGTLAKPPRPMTARGDSCATSRDAIWNARQFRHAKRTGLRRSIHDDSTGSA